MQRAKLFLQSSELGLPHPLTRRRVCPPLWLGGGGGGGHTRLRERGWGSPSSDERTYTVVQYIYMYLWTHPSRQDRLRVRFGNLEQRVRHDCSTRSQLHLPFQIKFSNAIWYRNRTLSFRTVYFVESSNCDVETVYQLNSEAPYNQTEGTLIERSVDQLV